MEFKEIVSAARRGSVLRLRQQMAGSWCLPALLGKCHLSLNYNVRPWLQKQCLLNVGELFLQLCFLNIQSKDLHLCAPVHNRAEYKVFSIALIPLKQGFSQNPALLFFSASWLVASKPLLLLLPYHWSYRCAWHTLISTETVLFPDKPSPV